jgi:pimeloyl-ACP methyl ester carboxylesterase
MASRRTNVPGVVFLHGIGAAGRVWAPQAASFSAAGYTVAALDLLGYGARPPVVTMDFDELAADIEAALAERRIERPVLVGHSMGGMVAQSLLRRRPGGYRAAALCCTSAAFGSADGAFQRKFAADRLAPLDAGKTMADLAPALVERIMGPAPDPAGRTLAIEAMSAVPESTYRAAVRCLVAFDERANLGRIAVPVLCLAGEQDPVAPAAVMERMAARIPNARYVCLPGVGHLPNLGAAAAFDAAILAFLHQVLDAPTT